MAGIDFLNVRQPAIRAPIDETDKSTIVSIYPFEVIETKHTLAPLQWKIPGGSYENPSVAIIGPASWFLQPDVEKPPVEISENSKRMAKSVIDDWCSGLLECSLGSAQPGLFFLPGAFTVAQIKSQHKADLDAARDKQRAWYEKLVTKADSLWSQHNGNPIVISELMKHAAQELGFKDKEWLRNFETIQKVTCDACGSLRNPKFPVCPICRAIDTKSPMAGVIKFAG